MKNYFTCLLIIFTINVFSQNINLNHGETEEKTYFEEFDFEFVKNKIIVSVQLADNTYKFILDTGAPNIISKELDSLLKPKIVGRIPVYDANNVKNTLKLVSVDQLKFGNVTFKETYTLVNDLNNIPVWKCFGIDGFIGSNMLRNSIVQIDLENKKIRLTNDRKNLSLDKKNSSRIKLTKIQSSPYMWIELSGKESSKEFVLIDTGADGLYDLGLEKYRTFEDEQLFEIIGESTGTSSIGLFGNATATRHYRLQLPLMKINGLQIEDYVTTTTNDDGSRIGSGILSHGIVTIDYLNKRFYLQPEFKKINANEPYFGFSGTIKKEKYVVGFVWDSDLKKKIGYGNEILEINGKALDICDIIQQNPFSKNADTVKLKIKSAKGDVFELMVKNMTENN